MAKLFLIYDHFKMINLSKCPKEESNFFQILNKPCHNSQSHLKFRQSFANSDHTEEKQQFLKRLNYTFSIFNMHKTCLC